MEIKILFRQGKSIREISRLMKISRNTVRRHLRREEIPSYKSRKGKLSKLADYYGYLQSRIESAKPEWIPATVLFYEVKEKGYSGSLTILRSYISQFKPTKPIDPVIRFETNPGQQMQVDWIEFRRGKDNLSAFVATLGFSRASFVEFVTNQKLETLLLCHEKAFEFFGGVPYEILYDNMKTVVIERHAYAENKHRFQPGFLDFARHYGFLPKLCRPYRAKTKGKVERFNRYLRYSFYYPLASKVKPLGLIVDAELANYEVKCWLRDIANRRVHATTSEVPILKLEEEKKFLQVIPEIYTGLSRSHSSIENTLLPDTFSIQHPLSLYDTLLQENYT